MMAILSWVDVTAAVFVAVVAVVDIVDHHNNHENDAAVRASSTAHDNSDESNCRLQGN